MARTDIVVLVHLGPTATNSRPMAHIHPCCLRQRSLILMAHHSHHRDHRSIVLLVARTQTAIEITIRGSQRHWSLCTGMLAVHHCLLLPLLQQQQQLRQEAIQVTGMLLADLPSKPTGLTLRAILLRTRAACLAVGSTRHTFLLTIQQ